MGKTIFASYSWDSNEHKQWVAKLINDLRSKYGFNATCDTIRNDGELDTMIVEGITKSDKIIIVITPEYTYRAENLIGGVGKETKLLHTRYFENDKSIIPILKERTTLPAYLKSVPYIDFTKGTYNDNLNQLVKRLNDKSEFEASKITKNPIDINDYDLLPNLCINDPAEQRTFLKEEFGEADQRILSLIEMTKKRYASLEYERIAKEDIVRSNRATIVNDKFVYHQSRYYVVTYKVLYNEKSSAVKFWLDINEEGFGNGIFGLFNEVSIQQGYNSYNFCANINYSNKKLELNTHFVFGEEPITTGKQLGEYIFKTLMRYIQS